jgi:hypothetical protein
VFADHSKQSLYRKGAKLLCCPCDLSRDFDTSLNDKISSYGVFFGTNWLSKTDKHRYMGVYRSVYRSDCDVLKYLFVTPGADRFARYVQLLC